MKKLVLSIICSGMIAGVSGSAYAEGFLEFFKSADTTSSATSAPTTTAPSAPAVPTAAVAASKRAQPSLDAPLTRRDLLKLLLPETESDPGTPPGMRQDCIDTMKCMYTAATQHDLETYKICEGYWDNYCGGGSSQY